MKALFTTLAALALAVAGASAQSPEEEAYFRERIKTLSSDEFGGRAPMSDYETKTINYIADEFKAAGLLPANGESYFQPVKLMSTHTRPEGGVITAKTPKGKLEMKFYDDVVVWTDRGTERVEVKNAEYVFCGFGINAPEYGWNDYEGVDVKDKIVIAMVNDPGFYVPELFRGRNMTYYGRWTYKFEEAARQGAAGLLVLHDTAAASYGWEVVQSSNTEINHTLGSDDMNMNDLAMKGWISHESCRQLFEMCGMNLEEAAEAAKKRGFKSFPLKAKTSTVLNVKVETGNSHNVAGILHGTDLKDEYVLFTAHWDHLGVGQPIEGDSIYNGANDNASGTAALMMLAKKMKESNIKPRRSIVFIAVTAEETGLLGSEHYCEHPLFPLEKTAAVINIDGAAPQEKTYDLTLRAPGMSDTDKWVELAAAAQGRVVKPIVTDPAGIYFRMDHFNFVKKGVPAILVSSGNDYVDKEAHAAKPKRNIYHQPTDEYDESWEFDGAFDNLNLHMAIALMVANNDEMPQWAPSSSFQRTKTQSVVFK